MKKKSNKPAPMKLSPDEVSALCNALDFLAHCDSFSYEETKFSHGAVTNMAWEIESNPTIEKRRDFRIAIAAIDLSVRALNTTSPELEQVSSVFPDLIPDLKDSLSLLESIRPRLAAHATQ